MTIKSIFQGESYQTYFVWKTYMRIKTVNGSRMLISWMICGALVIINRLLI